MSKPKTFPCARPEQEFQEGWVRKCDLDDALGRNLPIPTQVVSNEEYYPLPQTPEQRAVEHRLTEMAGRNAKTLGMHRRQFLRTACGMATAFVALNRVFGRLFRVDAAEMLDPAALAEKRGEYFIFDIQTHHVAAGRHLPGFLQFRRIARAWNPELAKSEPRMEDIYLANYIKEVFLDSETDVAVISGIPALTDQANILPPDQMVKTRLLVNRLAGSQRVVSHGLMVPDMGKRGLETMQVQAESLKIEACTAYPGVPLGPAPKGWWLDDEKVAFPAARSGFTTTSYVPWVSDLCEYRKKNPHMTNVYMELGSTFGLTVITQPLLTAHMLGMIIQAFGADHLLWGTDSIWWGSPQWQIEALRRLEMPEQLSKQFGYAPLTPEVKRQVFGLNAARLYGVDPAAKRNPIPGDYVDRLKQLYQQSGSPTPSNTQYGWVSA